MGGGSPRFRRDLEASPVEADGVVYVEVSDRKSGNGFRFYDFEHTVAQAMDGRPLPVVADDLRARYEIDLTAEQLSAFAEQLAALGFLDPEAATPDLPEALPDDLPADLPSVFPPLQVDEAGDFSRQMFASKPAEAKPAEAKPAEAKPAEAKAPAAKPPEAKAPEAKPAETKVRGGFEDLPTMAGAGPGPLAGWDASLDHEEDEDTGTREPGAPVTGPRMDRTLTSFPPEVLPVEWPGSPAPKAGTPPPVAAKTPPPSAAKTPPPAQLRTPAPISPFRDAKTPPPFTPKPEVQPIPAAAAAAAPAPATPAPVAVTKPIATLDLGELPDLPDLPALADLPAPRGGGSVPGPNGAAAPAKAAGTTPAPVVVSPAAAAVTTPAPVPISTTALPAAATSEAEGEHLDMFSPDFGSEDPAGPSSDETLADFKDPAAPNKKRTPAAAAAPMTEPPAPAPAPSPPEREPASEAVTPRATQPPERTEHPTQRLRAVPADPSEVGEPVPFAPDPAVPQVAAAPAGATAPAVRSASGELSAVAPPVAAPFESSADEIGSGRRTWVAYGLLSVAAAVVIAFMAYRFFESTEPVAVAVSTMVPAPKTVYRFWDATAKIDVAKATPFAFGTDGKVAEIVAAGTHFGAGDVLAMLESGKKFSLDLTRARERLLHYEGMRDKMTEANNKPELRQAELKIVEKKRLIAEAQAALAKHSVIAAEAGEVAEALVAVGDTVKAGDPVLRTKGTAFAAAFELPREDAEKARQLGFCRIEIEGKPLDCSLAPTGGDETHVAIELPNDPAVAAGKTVRLARNRLDAVFSIPTSALLRVGETDRLFVVGPSGRAELRVVAVADRAANDAIVTQGIDVGDRVIVAPPPGLRPDTKVLLERAP
jgi:multidrug efflux pump subunit AcrA (membrane-fusion protein)